MTPGIFGIDHREVTLMELGMVISSELSTKLRRAVVARKGQLCCHIALILFLAACSSSHDLDHRQIYVGDNGPDLPGVQVLERYQDVEASWLPSKLNEAQLHLLKNAMERDGKSAIVYMVGKNTVFSGYLEIVRVKQMSNRDNPQIELAVRVGQFNKSCVSSGKSTSPFALATIDLQKSARPLLFGGYEATWVSMPCIKK